MILRAILTGSVAYALAVIILLSISRFLTIGTWIIAAACILSGLTVLTVMSWLQQNVLNLTTRTLVIQLVLSAIVTVLLLFSLMIPVSRPTRITLKDNNASNHAVEATPLRGSPHR
jgi:hypothetical protein